MTKKSASYTSSLFFCTQCGGKGVPLPRSSGQKREAGHLKKLYCLICKQEVNHVEVQDMSSYNEEDFKMEYELGRFKKDGTRAPMTELVDCSCQKCSYNVNGKCWNANRSYKCRHKPAQKEGNKNE